MTAWIDPREAVRQAVAILGAQYLQLALEHFQGRQAGSTGTPP